MRPPCPPNCFVSESIPVNRLVRLQIPETPEIVVSAAGVVGTIVVVVPGAHGIVRNVPAAGDYISVQLILHHALFRRRTLKSAVSAAQPGFLVVVVTLSASGRRPLPLPVGRRVAAVSEVPAQADTGPLGLASARRESPCALPTAS
jgi:hypothetical protein